MKMWTGPQFRHALGAANWATRVEATGGQIELWSAQKAHRLDGRQVRIDQPAQIPHLEETESHGIKIKFFSLTPSIELFSFFKTRLVQLGVKDLFNGADLSRMFPGGGVAVNEMMHEAFIQVSEAGTEAAAATIVFDTRGTRKRIIIKKFIADQPFLFFIRDKSTGIVYFYGRVVRPEKFNSEA